MKLKILIIEDNKQILTNLEILLKFSGFDVFSSLNGIDGLEILYNMIQPPDLIISDIMMPEMDGYEFFNNVTGNPRFIDIPFIFLTAKSSPNDIRLGKRLGVDDYITKPFISDNLLATINGKILKSKAIKSNSLLFSKKFESLIKEGKKRSNYVIANQKSKIDASEIPIIMYVEWDGITGPLIKFISGNTDELPFNADRIGEQLFQTAISLYGSSTTYSSENVVFNVANIKKRVFLHFDEISKIKEEKKIIRFMIAVLSSKITYLDSLRIKEHCNEVSKDLKLNQLDFDKFSEEIKKIF